MMYNNDLMPHRDNLDLFLNNPKLRDLVKRAFMRCCAINDEVYTDVEFRGFFDVVKGTLQDEFNKNNLFSAVGGFEFISDEAIEDHTGLHGDEAMAYYHTLSRMESTKQHRIISKMIA